MLSTPRRLCPRPVPQGASALLHSVLSRIPSPACRRACRVIGPTALTTSPKPPAKGLCVLALPSIGSTLGVHKLFRYVLGRALFAHEPAGFVHRLTRFLLLGHLRNPFDSPTTLTIILVIQDLDNPSVLVREYRQEPSDSSVNKPITYFLLRLRTSAPTAEMTSLRSRVNEKDRMRPVQQRRIPGRFKGVGFLSSASSKSGRLAWP